MNSQECSKNAPKTKIAKHAIHVGVFGHMVGCAPANPLLVTGNAGLFSAGVVTKAVENL